MHDRLVGLEHEIEEIGRLFERIGAVGDDDAVGFVLIEDRMDLAHQIEPIGVDQRLARQATERDLLHTRDGLELGKLSQQFAITQPFVRLDVPGEIQAIDADGIDRPARQDQSHF